MIDNYKIAAKNTLVVGGAQVVQMGSALLRAKLIAVVLGSLGVGINSLFLSSLLVFQQVSSMGIYQSGVREMSITYGDNNVDFARIKWTFFKLSRYCGLFGIVVMILMSPILSFLLFGGLSKTLHFICLSFALYFMNQYNAISSLLQATGNLKLMSKATIIGTVTGLFVSVACICSFKVGGIIPAMVGGYVCYWLAFKYVSRRILYPQLTEIPSNSEFIRNSKPIIKLGLVLMVSSVMITLFSFLLNAVINEWGSVEEVGFYQSVVSIMSQSLLIANIVLASDFYPRLSVVNDDNMQVKQVVDQQIDLLLCIIVPISALLIVLAPLVVWILYTSEFYVIIDLIRISSLSFVARIIWMIFSYIILAKGDKKSYFLYDALFGNSINFILSVVGFFLLGIKGIVIANVIGAIVVSVILGTVVRNKYGYVMNSKTFGKTLGLGFVLVLLATISIIETRLILTLISYVVCCILCFWSIRGFFKKMNLFNR